MCVNAIACVCVCACVCLCLCVCVYVCMYVCVCVFSVRVCVVCVGARTNVVVVAERLDALKSFMQLCDSLVSRSPTLLVHTPLLAPAVQLAVACFPLPQWNVVRCAHCLGEGVIG